MEHPDIFFTKLDITNFLSDFDDPYLSKLKSILLLIFSKENGNGKYPNFNELFNLKDSNDALLRSSLVATLRNYFTEFPIGIELEINLDTVYSILGILYQKYKLFRHDLDKTEFSILAYLYSKGLLPNSPYLEIWVSFFNQLISTKFIPCTTQSILKNIIKSKNINLTEKKLILILSNILNFDPNYFNEFIYSSYKIIKIDIMKEDIDIIEYLCNSNISFKTIGFRYSLLVFKSLEKLNSNNISPNDINNSISSVAHSFNEKYMKASQIKDLIIRSFNNQYTINEFFLGYFASK